MAQKIKNLLKYLVMLLITALLLWLSFNSIEVEEGQSKIDYLVNVWSSGNKWFLFLSAFAAIASHTIRAQRWKLLLNPLGYKFSLINGFLSVMIGYFINLVIPRGGEVSRCYNLYRLNKIPADVSLGTVVAERVIDLIFLITLISISFFIELDNLLAFFNSEEVQSLTNQKSDRSYWLFVVSAVILIAALWLLFRFMLEKKKNTVLRLLIKTKSALIGVKDGAKSILALEKRGLFIVYSLLIWILYYFMMYSVLLAFPETQTLGMGAALTIFVIGGIAMVVPLPGGAGSFHVLVSTGLIILYGLAQDKAIAFTFIFHAWQTLVIIFVGAFSLMMSQFIRNNIEKHRKQSSTS